MPTGIGSMPYKYPKLACRRILETYNAIPYWPQLPKLGFDENMYVQYAYNLPGAVIDRANGRIYIDTSKDNTPAIERLYDDVLAGNVRRFKYDRRYFSGLYAMLAAKDELEDIIAFKGQITGPISIGLSVTDETRKAILYNDFYRDVMIKNLVMKAQWQEALLRRFSSTTILFIDEPYLTMLGSAFASLSVEHVVNYLNEIYESIEGLKGIHCCGNTDWSVFMNLEIDILSFDAYNYAQNLALYPRAVENFITRGGNIAWGIVPATQDITKETTKSLAKVFDEALTSLEDKGVDKDKLLSHSLLTPSCGLGTASVEHGELVLAMTKKLSELVRAKYGLIM